MGRTIDIKQMDLWWHHKKDAGSIEVTFHLDQRKQRYDGKFHLVFLIGIRLIIMLSQVFTVKSLIS